MKIVAVIAVVLTWFTASVASADTTAAPAGVPNVLCKEKRFTGRSDAKTPGIYSYKPRTCPLEIYEYPKFESAAKLLMIHWRSWTATTARGSALIPVIEEGRETRRVGRERVFVSLGRPRRSCGRLVFTRARVEWLYGDFDYPYRLHRFPVLGRGCQTGS